jgi:hypothetical protein
VGLCFRDLRGAVVLPVGRRVASFRGGAGGEVLSVDWNKYNSNVLVSAGLDRAVMLWVRERCGPLDPHAGLLSLSCR